MKVIVEKTDKNEANTNMGLTCVHVLTLFIILNFIYKLIYVELFYTIMEPHIKYIHNNNNKPVTSIHTFTYRTLK